MRGDAVDHQDERALWTLDSSNRRNNRKDTRRNRYNNRKVTRRNVNRRKFKKAWDRGYYDDWDRTFDDDFDFDNDLSAGKKYDDCMCILLAMQGALLAVYYLLISLLTVVLLHTLSLSTNKLKSARLLVTLAVNG